MIFFSQQILIEHLLGTMERKWKAEQICLCSWSGVGNRNEYIIIVVTQGMGRGEILPHFWCFFPRTRPAFQSFEIVNFGLVTVNENPTLTFLFLWYIIPFTGSTHSASLLQKLDLPWRGPDASPGVLYTVKKIQYCLQYWIDGKLVWFWGLVRSLLFHRTKVTASDSSLFLNFISQLARGRERRHH